MEPIELAGDFRRFMPPQLQLLPWKAHPLDGKLLLFERNSGLNLLMEGEEVSHLRRAAPRTLLIAITNACNMTCPFCYRDLQSRSHWTYESLMDFCREADKWGVLEVAFGGGEPMVFPRWQAFIEELYATTRLCINFTTNGTLLTDEFLQAIQGKYGQIRLSIYEDNHWSETIKLLVQTQARFGINWLINPAEIPGIEGKFEALYKLGVRDFLLLSYKGGDASMHLSQTETEQLAAFIRHQYVELGDHITLKLDGCWGDALNSVPRLFETHDCGARDDFLSITSDRLIKPCSFFPTHMGIPFETLEEVRTYWEDGRVRREAAPIGGCARLPHRGLGSGIIPIGSIN